MNNSLMLMRIFRPWTFGARCFLPLGEGQQVSKYPFAATIQITGPNTVFLQSVGPAGVTVQVVGPYGISIQPTT